MAGTFLTATIVAKEALMLLENELVMGNLVHRGYRQEFGKQIRGAKPGTSVSIRKPNRFRVTKARTRTETTVTESSITLNVATQAHVSWDFTTVDLTMKISEYSERYLKPAVAALANQVDADLCGLYSSVFNSVWESTGFVSPESFVVLGKAGQKLDEEAVPGENRCVVLNPAGNWALANALKNMYVTEVSKPALTKGFLARVGNFSIYMDQNIKTHTTGTFHDTGSTQSIIVATTGGATGTSVELIHFRVANTLALRTGDVFTIADVNAVNPMSGESTGSLRQFVVTGDVSVAATETSAIATVLVAPEMIDTGPYKTVDTLPAAGAVCAIVGTQTEPFPQNLAFHKNAFALVVVPLEMPDGVGWGARASSRISGMSIRVLKDYDIDDDEEIARLDILYGVSAIYPELACRIWGAEG
jgi:hypothetical protein